MKRILVILLSSVMLMSFGLTFSFADDGFDELNDPNEPLEYSYELEIGEEDPEINPRADIIKWRYKTIDGHLYRRKYNYTRHIWIGHWERV